MTAQADDDLREFAIDTESGRPLDVAGRLNVLEELWSLRSTVSRQARELYHVKAQSQESRQAEQKQWLRLLQLSVGVVDEFRLLLAAARRSVGTAPPKAGLFSGLLPAKDEAAAQLQRAHEWFASLERLLEAAVERFEAADVFHVPLLGQDVRTLAFDDQPMKRWVAVKNTPRSDALVVTEEVRGLWVTKRDGQLVLVQRGEVLV